jgi:hypothetical protein
MSGEKTSNILVNAMIATFFAVLIAVQSWTCMKILSHDNWIAGTQANRYTIQMAMEHNQEDSKKFSLIQDQLSDIRLAIAKLPDNLPPAWFLKEYGEFKSRVLLYIDGNSNKRID